MKGVDGFPGVWYLTDVGSPDKNFSKMRIPAPRALDGSRVFDSLINVSRGGMLSPPRRDVSAVGHGRGGRFLSGVFLPCSHARL